MQDGDLVRFAKTDRGFGAKHAVFEKCLAQGGVLATFDDGVLQRNETYEESEGSDRVACF